MGFYCVFVGLGCSDQQAILGFICRQKQMCSKLFKPFEYCDIVGPDIYQATNESFNFGSSPLNEYWASPCGLHSFYTLQDILLVFGIVKGYIFSDNSCKIYIHV